MFQTSYATHGKVLGGSSSVNWMIYVRGHKDDFDSWERLGCTGWGWNNVLNYFKKMEDYFMPGGMLMNTFKSFTFVGKIFLCMQ